MRSSNRKNPNRVTNSQDRRLEGKDVEGIVKEASTIPGEKREKGSLLEIRGPCLPLPTQSWPCPAGGGWEREGHTHLSDQLLLLLLTLLIPALKVPLELGLHGLQVHLQPQLRILSGLQLILQLLELGLHLLHLLLQGPLGLLQLMHLSPQEAESGVEGCEVPKVVALVSAHALSSVLSPAPPPGTHTLAHVVLGAHEVLHLGAELLVDPLQLRLLLRGLLQGPGQRQRLGLLLAGLCLSPVTLLRVLGRDALLLSQELGKRWAP